MIVIIISYILNLIDYFYTRYWVKKFGAEIEANPIGRWMFAHNMAWVGKIVVIGCLFALLWYVIKRNPSYAWTAYIPLAFYAVITVYHIIIAVKIALIK